MGAIITATTGCSGISIPRKIIPTWAFRACVTLVAAMLVAPVLSVEGQKTCIDRELQYRLDGDDLLWNNVRAVSTDDDNLFVLTQSSPRIHRFDLTDGTHLRSWGQRGQGPGEFQSSSGITLVGEHVYVLDSNQGRLSIFELTGDLVRTIPLQRFGMPPNFPSWLDRATGDTVLFGLSVPMGN
ncbi:MAG: 6-bladed beta-propeller, partial [Rhodothermaceae bacterium]|nr:6-bladed beta-propeller [Rhodothermaceae bacterium]